MKNIQAVFVDRDGTLIEDKHYLSDPAEVQLLAHVGETLKKIQDMGMQIFIVTNQSGIGRGYFAEKDFQACQRELCRQLEEFGVSITDTAFCPHDPSNLLSSEFECVEMCACRKPNIGMWHQLEEKYHLKASECMMVGDKKEDLAFGINAGFANVCLVPTGKGLISAKELGIVGYAPLQLEAIKTVDTIEQRANTTQVEEMIEFSSECVDRVIPCGIAHSHLEKHDEENQKAETKCFALMDFKSCLKIFNVV